MSTPREQALHAIRKAAELVVEGQQYRGSIDWADVANLAGKLEAYDRLEESTGEAGDAPPCPECEGSGSTDTYEGPYGTGDVPCGTCDGTGMAAAPSCECPSVSRQEILEALKPFMIAHEVYGSEPPVQRLDAIQFAENCKRAYGVYTRLQREVHP